MVAVCEGIVKNICHVSSDHVDAVLRFGDSNVDDTYVIRVRYFGPHICRCDISDICNGYVC